MWLDPYTFSTFPASEYELVYWKEKKNKKRKRQLQMKSIFYKIDSSEMRQSDFYRIKSVVVSLSQRKLNEMNSIEMLKWENQNEVIVWFLTHLFEWVRFHFAIATFLCRICPWIRRTPWSFTIIAFEFTDRTFGALIWCQFFLWINLMFIFSHFQNGNFSSTAYFVRNNQLWSIRMNCQRAT